MIQTTPQTVEVFDPRMLFTGTMGLVMLGLLVLCLVYFISMWVVLSKCGESGWWLLVPFFNIFVILRAAGQPWWFFLLMFVPGINFVVYFLTLYGLAERLGWGWWTAVGLFFFPWFFLPFLALVGDPQGGDY